METSNSRDPLGVLVLVYEAVNVGLVEEGAAADLDDPDLLVLLETPEAFLANPELAGRLPRREEFHAFPPKISGSCNESANDAC